MLKEEGSEIRLAKIDATQETTVAEQYSVSGYPTIKLFRGSEKRPLEFTAGRMAEDFVVWLKKKSEPPATEIDNVDAAKSVIDNNEVVVFGFFKVNVIINLYFLFYILCCLHRHPRTQTHNQLIAVLRLSTSGNSSVLKIPRPNRYHSSSFEVVSSTEVHSSTVDGLVLYYHQKGRNSSHCTALMCTVSCHT